MTSLKGAFNWSLWKWLVTGSAGILLSVLQIGKNFFSLDAKQSAIYAVGALLLLYLARFFLLFIVNALKYYHEVYHNSAYGEAIIILKDSFAQAHAYRKTGGYQDKEFITTMLLFCNNLKIIYDKLTKSSCSVSIKVPIEDNKVDEKTVFMNLTRDTSHKNRDTKEYSETKHTLIGNTAFSFAFNRVMQGQREKHYINNDVKGSKNYENTSKSCSPNGVLLYSSELVHPIVPIISQSSKNFDCLGFICIDCEQTNAFESKYMIGIIEGVADGLYDIISQRNTK
jgi:hypothetical protein